jgi:CheY-like chemotaxis protein
MVQRAPKSVFMHIKQGSPQVQQIAQILIIEDEPLISMDLESLVENLGHTVTGIARTYDEAIRMAQQVKPNLILADIQLADGSSGLDAASEIAAEIRVPVVFITAYPEKFLCSEVAGPALLLAKPFQVDQVRKTIDQALEVVTD